MDMHILEVAEERLGKWFCRRCIDQDIIKPADERYSMGVYAGKYCDDCWAEDGHNHDRDFDQDDAGEHYSEEDY